MMQKKLLCVRADALSVTRCPTVIFYRFYLFALASFLSWYAWRSLLSRMHGAAL
jgi:hypothetical protein